MSPAGTGTVSFGPPPPALMPGGPMPPGPPAGIQQQPAPPGLVPAQQVYQPITPGASLPVRLEQMLMEGRIITSKERYRHQRNREAYRGNTYLQPLSVARSSGQLKRLAPGDMLSSGQRRDHVNLLRALVDSRNAILTREKPAHEAVPSSRDRADRDAANVATALVDFMWDNPEGWDIAGFLRRLQLWAEQDGISFSCVTFDRSKGGIVSEMWINDPMTGQQRPATDVGEIRALQQADPNGEVLWESRAYPRGEVVLRPVRMGALAFDPNLTTRWEQCGWVIESRQRKIAEVEREVGRPIRDLIGASDSAMGRQPRTRKAPATTSLAPDDGGRERLMDTEREVLVHELFATATGPTGEWPDGAHVMWIQDAAATPIVQEPWLWPDGAPRCLPYRPHIPRPDGGHILETLGTVDELLPVQQQFDRRMSQYGEWLDLAARPPLLMVGGALRSKSVFNADRVVHVNPGFSEPRFMTVPPDPGISLMQALAFLEQKMESIAMQSGPVRGEPVPGIEAASAYNSLIQQGEGQLAGPEAELKAITQWTVAEALRNVQWFYTVERTIEMPGIEDEAAFVNFTGSKIQGATAWRITGSMMPRNKAAQQQLFVQFMQYAGPRFDPTPYAAELLEGDYDTIANLEKRQTRKQASENIDIAGLGRLPVVDQVWQAFTRMRDVYVQAMAELSKRMAGAALDTGIEPGASPQQVMRQMGPPPPRVIDMLSSAGFRVPRVIITDRDAMHIRELEDFMTDDAFQHHHPLVQQVALEHLNEHLEQMSRRTAAAAMQTPAMANATPGAQPPQAPPPPNEE